MQTISYTLVRAKLANTMQKVCDDHSPVVVTRKGAQPIVMISLEDYEAIEETRYLLQNPANAFRLAAATDEIEAMIAKEQASKK